MSILIGYLKKIILELSFIVKTRICWSETLHSLQGGKQHIHDRPNHTRKNPRIRAGRMATLKLHRNRNRKRPNLHKSRQRRKRDRKIFGSIKSKMKIVADLQSRRLYVQGN